LAHLIRVALATCAELPDLDEDGPALLDALDEHGVEGVPAVWTDTSLDWQAFDLVVVRSTWDYPEDYPRFLDWLERLPRVLNPAPVLRWSTDKHYLLELAAAGAPVVPSRFLALGEPFDAPSGRFVVKPTISAGGRRSAAYEAEDASAAAEHVARLHEEGRAVIVQPYLEAVDKHGETGIVYLGGRYSHGFRKGPLLRTGHGPGTALFLEEDVQTREPSAAELAAAERALAALPFSHEELLYARVDLAPANTGEPLVLEVELAEPSLYLGCREEAADLLAGAIAAALHA
jgi:glutathione synthase/RimK-type ligase-like ATP-grasp enzyme